MLKGMLLILFVVILLSAFVFSVALADKPEAPSLRTLEPGGFRYIAQV